MVSANLLIDDIIDFYVKNDMLTDEIVTNLVANNTTPGSPLRRLLVDAIAHEGNKFAFEALCELESIPRAFLADLLLKRAELMENVDRAVPLREVFDCSFLSKQPKCCYHQHDELHPACVVSEEKDGEGETSEASSSSDED